MHVIVGLTSQTDGQALRSAGIWQVGSPARLACCFSSPAFHFSVVPAFFRKTVTRQFQLNPLTASLVFPHTANPREHLFKESKLGSQPLPPSLCTKVFPSPRRCCADAGGHTELGMNPACIWQGSSVCTLTLGIHEDTCDVGLWQIILIPYMLCYIPFHVWVFFSAFTNVGSLSSTNFNLPCLY